MTVVIGPSSKPPERLFDAAQWNPYYMAFARVHGRTPDEQREHDATMTGFIVWIGGQWETCRITMNASDGRRRTPNDARGLEEHAALTAQIAAAGPLRGLRRVHATRRRRRH